MVERGFGDHIALIGTGRRRTYKELADWSNRLAHALVENYGVKPGNRILIRSGNNPAVVRNELDDFVLFVRFYDPSHHYSRLGPGLNSTMIGINTPIRIGKATVLPGDVVLERDGGVLFIPPQLAEKVCKDVGDYAAARYFRASAAARAKIHGGTD